MLFLVGMVLLDEDIEPDGSVTSLVVVYADPAARVLAADTRVWVDATGIGPIPNRRGRLRASRRPCGVYLPRSARTLTSAPALTRPQSKGLSASRRPQSLRWASASQSAAAALLLFCAASKAQPHATSNHMTRLLKRFTQRDFPTKQWWMRHQLHLATGWSLKDSWASNVTVISAAFAGIFGSSEVLKAVLGKDTTPVLALTTVSAAVAVGIVGAAPLILSVLRSGGQVTPIGLLSGAAFTVGGTCGELAIIALGSRRLALGGLERLLPWAGFAGELLLCVYAFRTMRESLKSTLRRKTKAERGRPAPPPGEAGVAEHDALVAWHNLLPPDVDPMHAVADAYNVRPPTEVAPPVRSAVFRPVTAAGPAASTMAA